MNTIRRNPPKPAPSRISGTLKARTRDTTEQAEPTAREDGEPARKPAAARADKPAPKGRPAREPGRGERGQARTEREPGRADREPRRTERDQPRAERAGRAERDGSRGARGPGRDDGTRTPRSESADRGPRSAPARSSRTDAPRAAPERRKADAPHPVASNVEHPARVPAAGEVPPEGVRLSKIMAERGICSRREADEFIERGWVFVDGKRVSELGVRIDPDARITLAAEATRTQQQRVTILLHKPVGYVSGQPEPGYAPAVGLIGGDNQFDRDTAQRFHPSQLKNLAPAGRLDIDSTGLLVLTQDGRIARQLIGADSEIDKEYLVRVEGTLAENGLALLNHGLWLDDRPLRPAKVEWINDDQLRFVLREGRKRQIRRMCELVGLQVVGLKRVRIGQVKLSDLPLGQWRYLREDERF
ncbi:pseudouridine synthase [Thauera sp.]|uniref:pseudouridine synthase n=1 Tax=Thauera sp. TaxID=1905334 RepID=UPI002A35B4CD|nr:pseudouridine synthase [Thauera sp.]MDX9886759.1 pseudouridine synthase [Thauera sp.]